MTIPLDDVTRKKLILVKQIFQRSLLQSQTNHNYVDRIIALIGFDLANETILKAVISALDSRVTPADGFQSVIQQAESRLSDKSLPPLPIKANIQHVHNLRNDAQHKARYPNEIDVNDCRTYTRDFLREIVSNIWGESFESISLIDIIQDVDTKRFLLEAEQNFASDDFTQTVIKSMVAFIKAISGVANAMTDSVSSWVRGIVVTKSFDKTETSENVYTAFIRTRELIVFQTIGINTQEYLKYKRITRFIGISIAQDGNYSVNLSSHERPTKDEAEYVLNFVTNSIVLIESLDEDITKAYDRLR